MRRLFLLVSIIFVTCVSIFADAQAAKPKLTLDEFLQLGEFHLR